MNKLDFFTPITYSSPSKSFASSLLEKIDHYFLSGGQHAYVIHGLSKNGQEKVVLSEHWYSPSILKFIGDVVIVISYFTLIIPLFMLAVKTVLRSTYKFKVIDPKLKLEKGLNISEEIVVKIKKLMPKILGFQNDPKIQWLSKGNNLVFKLVQEPRLVFKIRNPEPFKIMKSNNRKFYPFNSFISTLTYMNREIQNRYDNMLRAKKVCLINHLNLLTIPHAKDILVKSNHKTYHLIVEENLDFHPAGGKQEELFEQHSKQLDETVKQLATFIANTGFNDVTWRNIPILNENQDFLGPRRIALIDLEHMENRINGFIGDPNKSCGLIGCVSQEQIDIVLAEANKQNVDIPCEGIVNAKKNRLQDIEKAKELLLFYKKKGILNGQEPILVDLSTLDLNLNEELLLISNNPNAPDLKINLRSYILSYLRIINEFLQKKAGECSIKSQRYFTLSENNFVFHSHGNIYEFPSEQKSLWLPKIIEALVKKGYFFKLDKVENGQYFIQA